MNTLGHFKLGARIPDSPHAVCSSLPTMRAVRAYEEKDLEILKALKSGYPRFVMHEYLKILTADYKSTLNLQGRECFLVNGRCYENESIFFIGESDKITAIEVDGGVQMVHIDRVNVEVCERFASFIQHIGCNVSSRQAEDIMVSKGILKAPFDEFVSDEDPVAEVTSHLADLYGCPEDHVVLCSSGMNAFYSAFKSISELQRRRNRGVWVQFGWLYIDSGCILEKFLGTDESLKRIYDVTDFDAFADLLELVGDSLAAVVVEVPTNPLIKVADLERVASITSKHGGILIVDPSIASCYNVDVLRYSDVMVNSLTKYAANCGDVMAGALAVNPDSKVSSELLELTDKKNISPYGRDIARLAFEIRGAKEFCANANKSTLEIVTFFESHPGVKHVHWSGAPISIENYNKIARSPNKCGSTFSIDLNLPIEQFYDRLACVKGPSFGTNFTLVCPYMYLAHYDLVTSDTGRATLKKSGLNPELLRISIGNEPVDELIYMFDEALKI